ncbi:TetR/AcrR family transcriptional regulator [Rhodococcus pyridinivorans]|uniref:TetR/AcrR family transcriptional regulator n=1 Tax=Rhodococcus pyridinivorans TaxID=103816 RepID=UPI0009BEC5B9|nr:TetR/AcrR family transcriptional regulator [Rhodococcus pyridinivorans]
MAAIASDAVRTVTISHRERKRARTWTAIHLAAAEAAARHTRLSDITVETIAEQAEVSPRTFFNYFRSKEDAVLGLSSPVIDDAVADDFDFAPGDDLVEKVAFLLLAVFRTAASRRAIDYDEYIALMDRHPELARRRFQHIDDVEAVVAELVTERLAATRPADTVGTIEDTADTVGTIEDTADMIVTVAGALMRSALRPLLTAPGKTEADADSVLHRTCVLFREVTRP